MNQQLTPIQNFKMQIEGDTTQQSFQKFMPEEMLGKFTAVTIRAVQENPDLLVADRSSLFLACQKAAQDHLMPDGRESAFVVYNKNIGTRENPNWIKKVQYQPMIQGIRKRLAKAGFHMAAEIVYDNDTFSWGLGDNPHITHEPFLDGSRGEIRGAYAIATDIKTGQKYREYTPFEQLEQVRKASKNSDGGAWRSFPEEMHRKTPAKRLLKYLPLVEDDIFDMIQRDNEQFDMNKAPEPSDTAKEVQAAVRAGTDTPIEGEVLDAKPKKAKKAKKAATKKKPAPKKEPEASLEPVSDPLDF